MQRSSKIDLGQDSRLRDLECNMALIQVYTGGYQLRTAETSRRRAFQQCHAGLQRSKKIEFATHRCFSNLLAGVQSALCHRCGAGCARHILHALHFARICRFGTGAKASKIGTLLQTPTCGGRINEPSQLMSCSGCQGSLSRP